jgi:hypothetical protein
VFFILYTELHAARNPQLPELQDGFPDRAAGFRFLQEDVGTAADLLSRLPAAAAPDVHAELPAIQASLRHV